MEPIEQYLESLQDTIEAMHALRKHGPLTSTFYEALSELEATLDFHTEELEIVNFLNRCNNGQA